MTEMLTWRRQHLIRKILNEEASIHPTRRTTLDNWLVRAFHFASAPDGVEYWIAISNGIRGGKVPLPLSDEIKAKLVAIMLMPVKEEREDPR